MNDANVIPLSATRAGSHTMNGHGADAKPVRLRFDAFELDEPNALLLCDGKAVTLAPKPFSVLCALARRPAILVTKHALLDDVWGHHFVTDSVLKTAISEVRAALHDDAKEPRYIETVSKRGYRFIASVGASLHPARTNAPGVGASHDNPALAALTVLCRGDAALAELIRKVAASLEREPPFPMESLQERHA
jgi:DNA-binding winged helix-turn-helix (wHTH) protein